ncbi:hypothetical protein NL676_017277 [Syzygium grande]|nr:hypothetical protein NL676_017277 [Syzygium grande]
MAWTKKPNMENMANLPSFIPFTFSSVKAWGSSARPNGSKLPAPVDRARVSQVVQSALAEYLCTSLKPNRLAELDPIAGQELGEDAPEGAEHGPPRMDDLELAVSWQREWAKNLTRPGPYQGLAEATGFALATVLRMLYSSFAEEVRSRGCKLDGLASERRRG